VNQHGQSMSEIGDASMGMLILDTNVAVTDILQEERLKQKRMWKCFADVYECGTVT
jgi:hypothetical protein